MSLKDSFIEWKNTRKGSLAKRARRRELQERYKEKFNIEPYYAKAYDDNSVINFYTIAFNAPKLIDYQIKLVKKFLKGKYNFIVCDNSNLPEYANDIREICERNDITYIKIMPDIMPKDNSDSHGIALNWTFENVVKKHKKNFGFLDHDLFPVDYINAEEYLKDKKLFGSISYRDDKWYLWPGFAFFSYEFVKDLPLNFRRIHGLDTGGANWNIIYKDYDIREIPQVHEKYYDPLYQRFVGRQAFGQPGQAERLLEFFLDKYWLHIIAGSGWNGVHSKDDMAFSMLDKYLEN